MQGHGYPQPAKPPPTGALVVVRVLLVGVSVFSIGFLAWTMLLRLAIVTRKSLDWGLLVAALAADVLSIVLLGSEPGDDVHTGGGYLGLALLLGTLVASIVYYLAADIRHFQQLRQGGYDGRPRRRRTAIRSPRRRTWGRRFRSTPRRRCPTCPCRSRTPRPRCRTRPCRSPRCPPRHRDSAPRPPGSTRCGPNSTS